GYRVYRNILANNFSGAKLVRTFLHDPTNIGAIVFQDNTGGGKTYYYFVTSVDTSGQQSTPHPSQPSAVTSGNPNPNALSSVGSTSNPTQGSNSYAVITEMTLTLTTKGNKVFISFTGTFTITGTGSGAFNVSFAIFKDSAQLTGDYQWDVPTGEIG